MIQAIDKLFLGRELSEAAQLNRQLQSAIANRQSQAAELQQVIQSLQSQAAGLRLELSSLEASKGEAARLIAGYETEVRKRRQELNSVTAELETARKNNART